MGRPEIVWKRMSRSREAEGAFMKGVRRTGCPAHRVLLETNHRRFRHIESPPCRGRLSAEWLSGISHAHDQKSARFTVPIVQQNCRESFVVGRSSSVVSRLFESFVDARFD